MFERFTDRARHSIVLAQEEARRLRHNYIGTEHVLLGLLGEPRGIAAQVAESFGLTLEVGRGEVLAIIGRGQQEMETGHIPFTPRAKKCLELSLREALQLGNDYIGTEHVLLGIIREGKGVGSQILLRHAGSLGEVRDAVVSLMPRVAVASQSGRWLRRLPGQRTASIRLQPDQPPELRTTPAADSSLAEAARLAGAGPVGSHHILLAALADSKTAAAKALAGLGVDLGRALEALRGAEVTGSTDELPEDAGRRQMTITITGNRLTLEASDPEIVQLGRAAAEALRKSAGKTPPQAATGDTGEAGGEAAAGEPPAAPAGEGTVIRGDHPLCASLGSVWQSLHDGLEDIRYRAAASARDYPHSQEHHRDAGAGESAAAGESRSEPPEETAAGG
jgi:ATP-dependent Clp protease ATP-binding subunit ClpC